MQPYCKFLVFFSLSLPANHFGKPMPRENKINAAITIIFISFITFFVNNTVIVPDIMESRNIITAREMVYDGHWLIPTLNGDLRLEKPPLPTWITAVAEIISPDSLALQRGMAALAALLLVFYFYRFTRFMPDINPMVATMILCTCYSVILMGRTASWDIYCHAFMMCAIYYLCKGLTLPGCKWRNFIISGIMMGLSFLSKGPISFYSLLLPLLAAFAMTNRPSLKRKGKGILVTVVLCLVTGLWWYAYIYAFHPEAMAYVAEKESGAWLNHNVRPWYYYWKFFLESGVWSLLLPTAILLPLWSGDDRKNKSYLLPFAWMFIMLVLLSLFPEKKNRYLLPILIPASYLMGYLITLWEERLRYKSVFKTDKILFGINSWALAVVVFAIPVAAWIFLYTPGYITLAKMILFAAAIWAAAVMLAIYARRLKPIKMVTTVLALFLFAELFAMPSLKNVINNPEMESISKTRDIPELNGIPFYYNSENPLRIEIVYAAGRVIRPLTVADRDSLLQKLPCVVITHEPVKKELPDIWESADSLFVGTFDDNRWAKTHHRHSSEFVYNVTLLTPKEK